jgi:hypothetical protein
MNADKHDNMKRIQEIGLNEWKDTVTLYQSRQWFHDLAQLIDRTHSAIDRTGVMFGDGDLRQRVEWLVERLEEAETKAADAAGGDDV